MVQNLKSILKISLSLGVLQGSILGPLLFTICDRVCLKGPLVGRYKTEI